MGLSGREDVRLTRDVALLVAFSFPVSVSIGIRTVVLMPYMSFLGFSKPQMGLVATANTVAMAALALPCLLYTSPSPRD